MRESSGPYGIPVSDLGRWDVAVCGGGPAGVAAAVCAQRCGAKTIIIERWPFFGGLGTAAYVNGLHASDGEKQVIFGFFQELIERAERYDALWRVPEFPRDHLIAWYDSDVMKTVYDELVRDVGLTPLLYTPVVDVQCEGGRIICVIVGTPLGLRSVRAEIFVDATGDADLAAWAGAPTAIGRPTDGKVQGMTLMCRLHGVDEKRAWALTREEIENVRQKMAEACGRGELPPFGGLGLRAYGNRKFHPNMCPVTANPLDPLSLTQATIEARLRMMKFVRFWRRTVPGYERCDMGAVGALGVRESRRIQGEYVFSRDDVYGLRRFPDAVGHGFWMVDIHDPEGSGATTWSDRSNWLPAGSSYHIPYRILLPLRVDNLLVAGRCASTTHEGLAALRVQSHCMVMGEAAGTAAALSLSEGVPVRRLDVTRLQAKLRQQGVYLRDVPSRAGAGA